MSVNVPPPPPPPPPFSKKTSNPADTFEIIEDTGPGAEDFTDWDKAFDFRQPLEPLDMKKLTIDYEKKRFIFEVPHRPGLHYFVEVKEPRKRTEGLLSSYHEYMIRVAFPGEDTQKPQEVYRRFSQFEELYDYLRGNYPASIFPHLPDKSIISASNIIENYTFIEERTKSLDLYLKKLLTHFAITGKHKEQRILDFFNKNSDFTQVNKLNKMKNNLLGTAHLNISKTKQFFSGFFGSSKQESSLKYEYGGHEADELKASQNHIDILACNMEYMVTKTKEMITALDSKIEGLRGQQVLFNSLSQNASLTKSFKISTEFAKKMTEVHGVTEEQVRKYQLCLKEYFLFYFQDLQKDLAHASSIITDRFNKGEQIKANLQKLEDFEQQGYWDQHRIIVEEMNRQAKLYKKQAEESMNSLLVLHNKIKAAHYSSIEPLWKIDLPVEATSAPGQPATSSGVIPLSISSEIKTENQSQLTRE